MNSPDSAEPTVPARATTGNEATTLKPGQGFGHSRLAAQSLAGGITIQAASPKSERVHLGAGNLGQAMTIPASATTGDDLQLPGHTVTSACKYIVDREVGRGGMGVVHRVLDRDIRREVAMKLLLDDSAGGAQVRFLQEAQITGQLEHPNIVPIHDLGMDADGHLYFTMKMIRGRSLGEIIELLVEDDVDTCSRYTLGALLNIFIGVCNGMVFAHARGVIHRDLKPANIMIGDFGETLVMDWGLAKVLVTDEDPLPSSPGDAPHISKVDSHVGSHSHTMDGSVLGTPAYMPPEQARGDIAAIDERSDVYSLGAILYELLTLERAFAGRGFAEISAAVIAGKVVPPQERAPQRSIPSELSAVVMKAMAKGKEERYQRVEDLRQDIERFRDGFAVSAKEDTFVEGVVKLVRRNRQMVSVAAIAALMLAAVGLYSLREIMHERSVAVAARDQAEASRQQAEQALADARTAWTSEKEQREKVAEQRQREEESLLVDGTVERARRQLQEIDANLARRLDHKQIEELFADLETIIRDMTVLAEEHPQFPVLWFVRGQANFLRLRDEEAIADFSKALLPIKDIDVKDASALAAAIATQPYLPQAALGRARAHLRRYCSSYLVEQNFSSTPPEVGKLAAKLARDVQVDLTIAGEGKVPVLQGEVARLYLAYVNARSTDVWVKVVEPGARKLIEQGGRNEEAYFLEGLMTGFVYAETTKNFQASVDRYYCQPLAWLTLAWMHQEQHEWAKAEGALDEVFRIAPDMREAWLLKARIHRQQGHSDAALVDLEHIAEADRDGVYWIERARALMGQKAFPEALLVLDGASKAFPKYRPLVMARIEILLMTNEDKLALTESLRLANMMPEMERIQPWCIAWHLQHRLGLTAEAEQTWQRCVDTVAKAPAARQPGMITICRLSMQRLGDADGLALVQKTYGDQTVPSPAQE